MFQQPHRVLTKGPGATEGRRHARLAGAARYRSARPLPNWTYPAAMIGVVVILWHVLVTGLDIPAYLLPSPLQVAQRLSSDAGFIARHSWVTVYETIGGFVISIAVGIPLAILLVAWPALDKAIMPLLVLSQTFPKVAVAPLLIVWFGLGVLPKLLVSFLVAFFPIVISTSVGLRSTETEVLELARSMRAGPLQAFWKFRMPYALPSVFAGMKVAISFAIVGAVIGEWVGSTEGLGYLLLQANANLDTPLLFAILVALMIIGILLYYAIEWTERVVIPWHVSVRSQTSQPTM